MISISKHTPTFTAVRTQQRLPSLAKSVKQSIYVCNALRLVPCGDGAVDHIQGDAEVAPVGPIDLSREGLFEVGRIEPADILLPIPTVSARHATLRVTADGPVEVTDLGSTNRTYIDGEELNTMATTKLYLGSEIVFGDKHLAAFVLQETQNEIE